MTTVKEKFSNDNLFSLMNEKKPFAWAEKFTPEHMQNLFNIKFGNYVIASGFENQTANDIADSLADFFVDRWNSIYNFMFDKDLFTQGVNENVTETIVDDGSTSENGTDKTLNQVSAYNESDFQNDKQENVSRETNGTNKNNRTRTYSHTGYGETFAKYRLKYLDMLQNDFIYGIIFKEVKGIITVPLFDNDL